MEHRWPATFDLFHLFRGLRSAARNRRAKRARSRLSGTSWVDPVPSIAGPLVLG